MPKVLDIEIEESVGPEPSGSGRTTTLGKWGEMAVNDSVFFEATEADPKIWVKRTATTAFLNRRYRDRGWKFVTRKCTHEDGRLGCRIYRVA